MNKLIFITFIGFTMLGGCSFFSSGKPSEAELQSQYNMLLESFLDNIRVNKVDNVTCNQTGYAFPSEQEGPIFECNALVHFVNGKSIEDQLLFYRRPSGFSEGIDIKNSGLIEGLRQLKHENQAELELQRLNEMALASQEQDNQVAPMDEQESEDAIQGMSEAVEYSENQ